jgi:hypothetical protein
MKTILLYVAALIIVTICLGCRAHSDVTHALPSPSPAAAADKPITTWPNAPDEYLSNDGLKRAWHQFERSQKYRLAQIGDRNLTHAADARVRANNPYQIVPILNWWGARGYRGANTNDFVIAIVVDPSRSDPKRYGLVVIAAVASQGSTYKPYWVLREQDMESYLISPASGSVFIECFRRDGSEETKELIWERKSRQFRLV